MRDGRRPAPGADDALAVARRAGQPCRVVKDDAVVIEVRASDNPLASPLALPPWLRMLGQLPEAIQPRRLELPEGYPEHVTVEVLARALSGPEPLPWLRIAGPHGVLATLRAEGSISLSIPESLAKDHVGAILELAKKMASRSPLFGWAHPISDLTEDAVRRLHEVPQAEPCWISIVGARSSGEQHRLTGAGHRISLFQNGCTVIVAMEDFRLVKTRAGREKLREKFGRIRPDVTAAEVQAMLDARPPALPDVRKRPPSDSCALSRAPACDVADPAAAVAAYRASAQAFVERCGESVEGLDGDDAAYALEMTDGRFAGAHVYWEDELDAFTQELGAYLGECMVRELGGRWVPMEDRDRAYVVVGGRAWMPFQRVRRFLNSYDDAAKHPLLPYYKRAAKSAKQPG